MSTDALTSASALAPAKRAPGPARVPRLQGGPEAGRCLVVGVVNVTPDSFSDGGKSFRPERAIARGMDLTRSGADIIEVGGKSARPGAAPVPLAEERRRVIPVVAALAEAGAFVSVSTMCARVADDAVRAGARMVTDPSGGLADPGMLRFLAGSEVPYVVTYGQIRGRSRRLPASNEDVLAAVMAKLTSRIDAATGAGIASERLVVDPGLDLSTDDHYWRLLLQVQAFLSLGRPVMVDAPRRPFPVRPRPGPGGHEHAAGQQEGVSATVAVFAAATGAWGVRTHDAGPVVDGIRMAAGLRDG